MKSLDPLTMSYMTVFGLDVLSSFYALPSRIVK